MIRFDYHQPASVDEAITLLAHYGEEGRVLAGGTVLLPDMEKEPPHAAHLISLDAVQGLNGIRNGDGWIIGAFTTLGALEDVPAFLSAPTAALAEATKAVAGRQVRNMATVGGNLCAAKPGADMVLPLLCLDARLALVGLEGQREAPLDGFLLDTGRVALRPAEILTQIHLPPSPPRSGSAFFKVMRRHAMDCSIVAVAARITLSPDGEHCEEVRIAIGAAAPVPFRAREAEKYLEGYPLTVERVEEAAQAAEASTRPVSDVRATAHYRRMLVRGLVRRAIQEATMRARSADQ
jgi:CO/xanthine dehydrogenase FAD-binding subunit